MSTPLQDDIDFPALVQGLWHSKWLIVSAGLICGLVAVVVTLMLPNVYRSSAVLVPATDPTQAVPRSLASQVSSLAGISLGGSAADSTQVTLATLKSRAFLVDFIRRHKFEVPLIAGSGWDLDRQQWIIDSTLYDQESGKWIREATPLRGAEPSDGELYEAIRQKLDVNFDRSTGLVSVSLKSISPVAARDWLSLMVVDLNAAMRRRAINEAASSMQYLQAQYESTQITSIRDGISRLIEEQLRKRMLAEVRESYALTTIDPPSLPEEKVWPLRSLICIAAAVLGSVFASIVVLAWMALQPYFRKSGHA